MPQHFFEVLQKLIGSGLQPKDLTFLQITLRGVIVFVVALIMVRLADKRFFARKAAFDVILGFILASMLARAVNGSAAFFSTLGVGFILVGLHRLLGAIAFRSDRFGILVKGTEDVLVENGKLKPDAMRKAHISEKDLLADLRLNGMVGDPADVKVARLERDGKISVVTRKN
jgi:uncharacterized membrane protein YcaP (DUF421 family)